jgi:ABC-type iron transport system FetAB permease component
VQWSHSTASQLRRERKTIQLKGLTNVRVLTCNYVITHILLSRQVYRLFPITILCMLKNKNRITMHISKKTKTKGLKLNIYYNWVHKCFLQNIIIYLLLILYLHQNNIFINLQSFIACKSLFAFNQKLSLGLFDCIFNQF